MTSSLTRKRIRLPEAVYGEADRVFSVTAGIVSREPVFADVGFGLACVEELRELRSATRIQVFAYCLMPDHSHLLVGVTELLPLPKLVGAWKSRCYRAARQRGRMRPFWQRSFYDHALRSDEDLVHTARYVLANPVRAGLVLDSHDYPLCGSLEFDL